MPLLEDEETLSRLEIIGVTNSHCLRVCISTT